MSARRLPRKAALASDSIDTSIVKIEKTDYEKRIEDLTVCNRALSQALDTSYKIIEHHEKVISGLQKKLQLRKSENLKAKLQDFGSCVKQLVAMHSDMFSSLSDDINESDMPCDDDSDVVRNSQCLHVPNNITVGGRETPRRSILNGLETTKSITVADDSSDNRMFNGVSDDVECNVESSDIPFWEMQPSCSNVKLKTKSKSSKLKSKKRKAHPPELKDWGVKQEKKLKKPRLRVKLQVQKKNQDHSKSPSPAKLQKQVVHDENSMFLSNVDPVVQQNGISDDKDMPVLYPNVDIATAVKAIKKKKAGQGKKSLKKGKSPKLVSEIKPNLEVTEISNSLRSSNRKSVQESDIIFISDDNEGAESSDPSRLSHSVVPFHASRPSRTSSRRSSIQINTSVPIPQPTFPISSIDWQQFKLPRVVLYDILKSDCGSQSLLVMNGQPSCSDEPQSEDDVEVEDEQSQPLEGDVVVNDDVTSVIELPFVDGMKSQPVAQEEIVNSSPAGAAQEESNSSSLCNVESFPPDPSTTLKEEFSDDSFFRILEEVTRITQKLPNNLS